MNVKGTLMRYKRYSDTNWRQPHAEGYTKHIEFDKMPLYNYEDHANPAKAVVVELLPQYSTDDLRRRLAYLVGGTGYDTREAEEEKEILTELSRRGLKL